MLSCSPSDTTSHSADASKYTLNWRGDGDELCVPGRGQGQKFECVSDASGGGNRAGTGSSVINYFTNQY